MKVITIVNGNEINDLSKVELLRWRVVKFDFPQYKRRIIFTCNEMNRPGFQIRDFLLAFLSEIKVQLDLYGELGHKEYITVQIVLKRCGYSPIQGYDDNGHLLFTFHLENMDLVRLLDPHAGDPPGIVQAYVSMFMDEADMHQPKTIGSRNGIWSIITHLKKVWKGFRHDAS